MNYFFVYIEGFYVKGHDHDVYISVEKFPIYWRSLIGICSVLLKGKRLIYLSR